MSPPDTRCDLALSLPTLSYFPSSQMSNFLSHWVCISSGLCEDTLAQEGLVTQLGALGRPFHGRGLPGAAFHFPFCQLVTALLGIACFVALETGGAFRDMAL